MLLFIMASYLQREFPFLSEREKIFTKILVEDISRSDLAISRKWKSGNHENKVGVANFFILAILSARDTMWSVKPDRMEVNLRIHLEEIGSGG